MSKSVPNDSLVSDGAVPVEQVEQLYSPPHLSPSPGWSRCGLDGV